MSDRIMLNTGVFKAVDDSDPGTANVPPPISVQPFSDFRAVQLPAAFYTGNPAIALLTRRDAQSTRYATLYLERSYAFNGQAPASFVAVQTITHFALHAELTHDFPANASFVAISNALPAESADWPNPLPLVAGLNVQLDGTDTIMPDVCDFDALAGDVLLFVGDEIMSVSEATMSPNGAYILTVIRGAFGTAVADHSTGDEVFIMRRADIEPLQHPHFRAGNTATFKLVLGNKALTDAMPFDLLLK